MADPRQEVLNRFRGCNVAQRWLRMVYGINVDCCGSCHDDMDGGYDSAGTFTEGPSGQYFEGCCAVMGTIDDRKDRTALSRRRGVTIHG